VRGWAPVLAERPHAILYGTVGNGAHALRSVFGHYIAALAKAGMRMGTIDPGSLNLANHGEERAWPGSVSFVYRTSFKDIAALVDPPDGNAASGRRSPSMSPVSCGQPWPMKKAGRLPAGALVKFYFRRPLQTSSTAAGATSPSAYRRR